MPPWWVHGHRLADQKKTLLWNEKFSSWSLFMGKVPLVTSDISVLFVFFNYFPYGPVLTCPKHMLICVNFWPCEHVYELHSSSQDSSSLLPLTLLISGGWITQTNKSDFVLRWQNFHHLCRCAGLCCQLSEQLTAKPGQLTGSSHWNEAEIMLHMFDPLGIQLRRRLNSLKIYVRFHYFITLNMLCLFHQC